MYKENVGQYFDAKRMAARRLLGKSGSRQLRFRPQGLPSNGEIQEALLELAVLTEGHTRLARLFAMRVVALETMRALASFRPRLIGSVRSGHVRRGSDIDLHVFTDDLEPLECYLHGLGWAYDVREVTIQKDGKPVDYTHVYVEDVFPVELSVYPRMELRRTARSSTDGKPIVRLRATALVELIRREHPSDWAHYEATGEVRDLDVFLDEAPLLTLAEVEALAEEEDPRPL